MQTYLAAGFGFNDLKSTLNNLLVVTILGAAIAIAVIAFKGNTGKAMRVVLIVLMAGVVAWIALNFDSLSGFFGKVADNAELTAPALPGQGPTAQV